VTAIRNIILYLALSLVIVHNTVPHQDHTTRLYQNKVGSDHDSTTLYHYLFHAFQEGLPDLAFVQYSDFSAIQENSGCKIQASDNDLLISAIEIEYSALGNPFILITSVKPQHKKTFLHTLRGPPVRDML
jgi:hypothetical protein